MDSTVDDVEEPLIDHALAHQSDINSCHASTTGLLATCGGDRAIKIWKDKNRRIVELDTSPLAGHSYGVNQVRFSSFGTLLASASTDGTAVLWDVRSGERLCTFFTPSGYGLRTCAISPDSSLLAAGGDDDRVYIWSVNDKELKRTISAHEATVFSVSFSPDGQILMSSDVNGRILGWSAHPSHHTQLVSADDAHDLGVTSMEFSPHHSKSALETNYHLASCGNDGYLRAWILTIGRKNRLLASQEVFAHDGSAMCVAFNSKGDKVTTAGGDKTMKLWSFPKLENLRIFSGFERYVTCCSFSRDGRSVFAASKTTIKAWRLVESDGRDADCEERETAVVNKETKFQFKLNQSKSRPELMERMSLSGGDVTCCDIFNNILAVSSTDRNIRLWNMPVEGADKCTEMETSPLVGHTYSVYSIRFSHSGLLLSGSLDGEVILWEPWTGTIIRQLQHPNRTGFRVVQISRSEKILAAGGDDDTAHVWDGEQHRVIKGHDNTVFGLDISPDERFLVSGCSGELLKVWSLNNLNSEKAVFTVEEAHDLGVTCCAFQPDCVETPHGRVESPHGRVESIHNRVESALATGGNDAVIKVWLLGGKGELKLRHQLQDHGGAVMCLRYSSTGHLLASTSGDRTARIWDTVSYKCLIVVDQHARYVTSCAFSSCHPGIFVSTSENHLNIWRVPTEKETGSFSSLPIKDWTGKETALWLSSLEVENICQELASMSGTQLLKVTKDNLLEYGYDDDTANRIVQNIQWRRHGNYGVSRDSIGDVPGEFLCPITHEIMENPVRLADGFIYEEMAIKEWLLTRKMTSPMTNLELEDSTLVPCVQLKQRIQSFL